MLTLWQAAPADHWQQLGVGGGLAIALIALVLKFVLDYAKIRRSESPAPAQNSEPANGKSGERSVAFWEQSIGKMIAACVDKEVAPKQAEILAEVRALREMVMRMEARER